MSEFSEKTAERLSAKHASSVQRKEYENNQQQAKKERAPGLWGETKKALIDICDEINRDYKEVQILFVLASAGDSVSVELRQDGEMRSLGVQFLPASSVVQWATSGGPLAHRGEYPMHVHPDGAVNFSALSGDQGAARYITERMIAALTG